ncbi:MAG: hypothetical protein ACOVO5_06010, partial [Devosia sp.]
MPKFKSCAISLTQVARTPQGGNDRFGPICHGSLAVKAPRSSFLAQTSNNGADGNSPSPNIDLGSLNVP